METTKNFSSIFNSEIMKRFIYLLLAIIITGCSTTSYTYYLGTDKISQRQFLKIIKVSPLNTYYFGTEKMMQEECAMLWRLDNFIITAIDNEPTNLGVKYISDSNDTYKPENDSISTFLLKPGNHKITYYYHYEKFLKMNDPRFSMDKGSSRYFEKLGELNFNFEKGKYYIISIDDETGNFDLGEHNWVYWESILNKYIKVSIREYLFKKQKK